MELRHLECFVAVAEEANFSRAAVRLHVVQSAVSATIKSLERELGAPLLDRNSKRVLLTDAGAALLPGARAALDAAQAAADAVAEVRGGLRGTLRLGTMTSVSLIDLPALLGAFHQQHPGVLMRTTAASSGTQGLVDALLERRLDVAFVSWPGPPPAGIALTDLTSSVLDLAVPAAHPLAGRGSVPIAELAGLDFVDSAVGYGNRTVADRAFAAASLTRRVTIEITDIATGVAFVRHGLGVALLPRFALRDVQDVAVLRVQDADLRWPLSLAAPSDRVPSAAARAMAAMARQFVS
jgi:DNA-binding transcriptional LysR family regulator